MGEAPTEGGDAGAAGTAFHRAMYIDLIRAYLLDYGSQGRLARALGITDAFLSYLLEPHRDANAPRRPAAWVDAARRGEAELLEATRRLKTPSAEKAALLARTLTSDQERREVLLYHVDRARPSWRTVATPGGEGWSRSRAREEIDAVGRVHMVALGSTTAAATRDAYATVWLRVGRALRNVEPPSLPAEFASLLMYRHDVASVLGRHDLALRHARLATLCLSDSPPTDEITRLRTNALLAEVVSLNNLGLRRDVLALAERARLEPGYEIESSQWKRSFLEQRLSALAGLTRVSVHDAEATAERAAELVDDPTLRIGIHSFLLRAYCAHGSRPSLRRAVSLAEDLRSRTATRSLPPLRQIRLSRAIALLNGRLGDASAWRLCLLDAAEIAAAAGLADQGAAIARQLNADPTGR